MWQTLLAIFDIYNHDFSFDCKAGIAATFPPTRLYKNTTPNFNYKIFRCKFYFLYGINYYSLTKFQKIKTKGKPLVVENFFFDFLLKEAASGAFYRGGL